MSLYDYQRSLHISNQNEPFYALMMALIRHADTKNLAILKANWPHIWEEFYARYNSPGGVLESDGYSDNPIMEEIK